MRFQKGMVKTGGRRRGTLNLATRDIKEFARELLESPEYQESLKKRILKGKTPPVEVLLHYYVYGRPKNELEVNKRSINVIVDRSAGRTEEPVDIPAVALPVNEGES